MQSGRVFPFFLEIMQPFRTAGVYYYGYGDRHAGSEQPTSQLENTGTFSRPIFLTVPLLRARLPSRAFLFLFFPPLDKQQRRFRVWTWRLVANVLVTNAGSCGSHHQRVQ